MRPIYARGRDIGADMSYRNKKPYEKEKIVLDIVE